MNENGNQVFDIYTPENELKNLKLEIQKGQTTLYPGDKDRGTILYFKQTHYHDDIDQRNKGALEQIIKNQRLIYDDLKKSGAKDLFLEGVDETIGNDITSQGKLWENIRNLLLQKNGKQRVLLQYGGGFLYWYENLDTVILHIADSRKLKMEKIADPFGNKTLLDEDREDFLSKKLQEFLELHPGKTVAVVYGFLHNFEDNLDRTYGVNPKPVRKVISYQKLTNLK